MKQLAGFMAFIKESQLENAARESLKVAREMNIPLLRMFAHLPDEVIIPQSMKSLTEFADSLADGSYLGKQKENLKKWENDELEGISKDDVQPTDLVLVYVSQKKALHRFIPLYTKDPEEIIGIVDELELLHSRIQDEAINMLFRWRKDAEAELTEANRFLDAVLENIPNMIVVKDASDLHYIRVNKAGEKILGKKQQGMIGRHDHDFYTEEQANAIRENDQKVIAKGKPADIPEELFELPGKEKRWMHTRKVPVTGREDVPAFLLSISEDITETKKRDDEIMQLNAELEAFTYSVSHDLRAPLRAINGYANMIEEDYAAKMDAEEKRLLQTIRYNAEKMGNLIDDLLAFSRLGRKDIDRHEENMNQLVEGVMIELEKNSKHHAMIKVDKLQPASVDYGLMHQAFFNLLSNAVKYSSKVEKPLISVSSKTDGDEVVYCVKDNGVGFDMRYYNKLFGVFQRLHRADEFEGTGVGLAIVKRIVNKHRGRVWAEGKKDKGAAFYIALPLNPKSKSGK